MSAGVLRLRQERNCRNSLGMVSGGGEGVGEDEVDCAGDVLGDKAVDKFVEDAGPTAHLRDMENLHMRREGRH